MTLVVSLPDYSAAAQRLAVRLGIDYQPLKVHHFPDSEIRVHVPPLPPEHVILCQSLDRPNDKLIALLLACATLRQLGTRRISLVAPYLCYMRQDKAFHPGEAISQHIIGRFLAQLVDAVVTVDAHLHRITSLDEAIPLETAINLSAAPALGEFLARLDLQPLLLGPDAESAQWVEQVAAAAGSDHVVATKQRFSDQDVRVALPVRDYQDRVVILVDDVVSSGHTLAEAAKGLIAAGAREVHGLVTHALFAEGALDLMHAAGINTIWSSDSISHETNAINLDVMLAATLTPLL